MVDYQLLSRTTNIDNILTRPLDPWYWDIISKENCTITVKHIMTNPHIPWSRSGYSANPYIPMRELLDYQHKIPLDWKEIGKRYTEIDDDDVSIGEDDLN